MLTLKDLIKVGLGDTEHLEMYPILVNITNIDTNIAIKLDCDTITNNIKL